MRYLGIEFEMKHTPKLDPGFIPFGLWREAYLKNAAQPVAIAIERQNNQISVHHTFICGTAESEQADFRYLERFVKFLLWAITALVLTQKCKGNLCLCKDGPSAHQIRSM